DCNPTSRLIPSSHCVSLLKSRITVDYTLTLHGALPIFERTKELGDQPVRRLLGDVRRRLALGGGGFEQQRLEPARGFDFGGQNRSEEHTSELQSRENLVCRLLLEKENFAMQSNKYLTHK